MKLRRIFVFLLISTVAIAAAAATIGTPQVRPETSANGPAIVLGSPTTLLIAWTGTPNLQLNFQRRISGAWQPKVTLGETASAAPAVAFFSRRYYVAWTGTNAEHNLNVMSSADGVNWAGKVTLGDTSPSSPALAVFAGSLYLGWRGGTDQLNLISTTNGTTWGGKVTLADTTPGAVRPQA